MQDIPDAFLIETNSTFDEVMHEHSDWERMFSGPTGTVWVREGHPLNVPDEVVTAPTGFPS